MKTIDESLIVSLARILSGRTTEVGAMMDPLELLCDTFSFDGGMVYDIDQDNLLNLMEHYGFQERELQRQFPVAIFDEEYEHLTVEKNVIYLVKSEENTQIGEKILEFFSASSVILVFLIDEKYAINGLVAFVNTERNERITGEAFDVLSVMLSMFGRFASTRMFQKKLAFSETAFQGILDHTGIDIYVNDFHNHDILYVNRSMAAPYGGVSEFAGRKCWEVLFPHQSGPCEFCPEKQLIDDNGEPTKVYSWDYQRDFDGSWFRVFSAAFKWTDGRLAHVVSSADITDNKKNEELIQYLANYDSLTDLPNRRMLVEDCKQRIETASEKENGFILFFDIDGFKEINDNLGHDAGDDFLIQLGKFFSEIPLLKGAIYRNGGDEFVGLIGSEDITRANVRNLVNFILQRFSRPWELKDGEVLLGISAGIACYPEDGDTVDILLRKADQAMYQAKKKGGNEMCFSDEIK